MKKKKAKKPKDLKRWLIHKLRRLSLQWPPRYEAIVAARYDRGKYFCKLCNKRDLKAKDLQVDHIIEVVDIYKPNTTLLQYINGLFCEASNLQAICVDCHKLKSAASGEIRRNK